MAGGYKSQYNDDHGVMLNSKDEQVTTYTTSSGRISSRKKYGDDMYVDTEDRVNSPKNILDMHEQFSGPRDGTKRSLHFRSTTVCDDDDEDAEKRITIWNWREGRKLSGNSAPFKKNLHEYLRKHPDWEEYRGQDKDQHTGKKLSPKKKRENSFMVAEERDTMRSPSPEPVVPERQSLRLARRESISSYTLQQREASRSPSPERESAIFELSTPPVMMSNLPVWAAEALAEPAPQRVVGHEEVAHRRALEMAARRKTMEEEAEEDEGAQAMAEAARRVAHAEAEVLRREEAAQAAAWKVAAAEVARLNAERQAIAAKAAEERAAELAKIAEAEQATVIDSALARIQRFKRQRVA